MLAMLGFFFASGWVWGVRAAVFPVTADMRGAASAIIQRLLPASGVTQLSSTAWQRLAYLTDTFGPRFSGSAGLERALDWVRDTARAVDGLTVTEQFTMVPRWVRGNVRVAHIAAPQEAALCGLGHERGDKRRGPQRARVCD